MARDLHSVTGIWISMFALFLLATGLPWAKFWGNYFRTLRSITHTAVVTQDWTLGGEQPQSRDHDHAGHGSAASFRGKTQSSSGNANSVGRRSAPRLPKDFADFDRVYTTVLPLNLAHPVSISPPTQGATLWMAKSDAQNRTLRTTLSIDGATGKIIEREDFADRHFVDRLIGIGIAAHEGQLFGWANQLLGLVTALGLIMLSLSGYWMWWQRREPGTLGAPRPLSINRYSISMLLIVLMLALYLPMFGATLLIVLCAEKVCFAKIPRLNEWLGLSKT